MRYAIWNRRDRNRALTMGCSAGTRGEQAGSSVSPRTRGETVVRRSDRRCGRCRAVLRRGNLSDLCDPCNRAARTRDDSGGLPADFYARPEIVTALTTYDFGQFFKTARYELGVTQEDFGLLVGLAQSR